MSEINRNAYPTGKDDKAGLTTRQRYKMSALAYLSGGDPALAPEALAEEVGAIADAMLAEDERNDTKASPGSAGIF